MTAPGGRGGPRTPDGIPRPANLPMAPGPNRSDLAELPGTPGTPLPPNPAEPQLERGQVSRLRKMLGGIPLEQIGQQANINAPSQAPNEPVTAGIDMGAGPGSDSLLPSPGQLSTRMTAQEMEYIYPLLMRLATLPNATTESKILAQRVRANLPIKPEQMPVLEPSDRGIPRTP
jgi:hypothetical protein